MLAKFVLRIEFAGGQNIYLWAPIPKLGFLFFSSSLFYRRIGGGRVACGVCIHVVGFCVFTIERSLVIFYFIN